MLKFGNKDFRNLQEQVLKNMDDIKFILQEEGVLNTFGIKVVGQEESVADLPTVEEYKEEVEDWAYGDAFAIGEDAPYTLYVLTRANGSHASDYWFDIGEFPVPGPQGPAGAPGVPVFPEISVAANTTTLSPGQSASAEVVKTGTDAEPLFTFTFEIPQGAQGIQGPQGNTGPQGIQGPQGYINLLRPSEEACVNVGEGYMDDSGHLQLLTSLDPREFVDEGEIRGPRGFTGPTGERGPTGYVNILRATAEDCVALGEGYMNVSGYLMILTELDPRTFTNCGQLRGPQGSTGPQGPTGYVNIIRPNAESCTQLYDAYVDASGNLQILTELPDTFTYGGRIKGETGTAATVQVGTVTTGDPGTQVIITNTGTSSAAILNFTIPQGEPGEDVGINPTIPAGAPTSSLVAIKSGNDYYTVPQGETSLVFNVSIPSGTSSTAVSTIKDGQSYYTVPTKTSDLTNDSGFVSSSSLAAVATSGSYNDLSNKPTIPAAQVQSDWAQSDSSEVDFIKNKPTIPEAVSGVNDGTNWTSLTIGSITKALGTGSGSANIEFNATVPSGTTPTPLTTLEDLNTNTYYSIAGGGGTANIEFNPTVPSGTTPTLLKGIKDENSNTYYGITSIEYNPITTVTGTQLKSFRDNRNNVVYRIPLTNAYTISLFNRISGSNFVYGWHSMEIKGTSNEITAVNVVDRKNNYPKLSEAVLQFELGDGGVVPSLNFLNSKYTTDGSTWNYCDVDIGNFDSTWETYKGGVRDILVSGKLCSTNDKTEGITVNQIKAGLVPEVESTDKNKYLHTNETTGALEWAVAQDESIEANVEIPAGATVVELQNIKIGNVYYIMPGQTRYIVGNTLVDNASTSSIANNTLTDNSIDINTSTNSIII